MPTLNEVADHIQEFRKRLLEAYKVIGWDADNAISSYQSYGPGYSLNVVLEHITYTAGRVRNLSDEDLQIDQLGKYLAAIDHDIQLISFDYLANDPGVVINNVMMILQMINARLPSAPKGPVKIDWDSIEDKTLLPRDLSRRLGGVAARLASLEPRAAEIDAKINDIEAAHETAEQLPEDLAELAAKRDQVRSIVSEADEIFSKAKKISDKIDAISDAAVEARERMVSSEEQATKLIARSEQALRGSTGVGLANAFESRKNSLSQAGAIWVGGLILALLAALAIGAYRISALQAVLNNDSPSHIVWMNVILTVFGVGGPVWFAWLSTKQISVSFRLAEDYAFKAAVSKAYEGYRSEAISIDPALQERLFSSALDRFEESPIRLMEKESHSSPLQEILANPAIRKSLEGIPGIADKIIALIPEKGGVAAIVGSAAAVSTAVSGDAHTRSKNLAKQTNEE
ncbi:hypothetical protein [Agrobacterium vaccinii]|uniref:hypothetical protein n=1 Tax=Agrobacterium vaccinii TaxID=2735528 RepID=UPI001E44EA70|nr:hypothetical protein [Agrobacterium vaccinii]UHS56849.1 hypothetical protein HRS00_08560 [Agrobacterium vaccinii]